MVAFVMQRRRGAAPPHKDCGSGGQSGPTACGVRVGLDRQANHKITSSDLKRGDVTYNVV